MRVETEVMEAASKVTGRALLSVVVAVLVGLASISLFGARAAAAVPANFEDTLVTSVPQPTALAFTPDGRLLIATKPGLLRAYENGVLLQTPALDLSRKVCDNSERGLLGVAVDPRFVTNNYVYLYYTYKKHGVCPSKRPGSPKNPVNRVSRFVLSGNTIDPASEKILINNIPSPNGNHNAGDLHFGKDGFLYVSVGDGGCHYRKSDKCQTENDAARDRNVLLGKVLRITRNGGIPKSNPYTGTGSARCHLKGRTVAGKNCRETFARGLRNPFRMAFDPDATGTRFRINDVGAATWEEINNGRRGADYGWNCREGRRVNSKTGKCDPMPRKLVYPIHRYKHTTGCTSITGGAFVPNGGAWPASYDDAYLFGDFVCNKIFKLTPREGGGFTRTTFATGLGRGGPVAMVFGPHNAGQALYYTTFDGGGEVRRIAYTGAG